MSLKNSPITPAKLGTIGALALCLEKIVFVILVFVTRKIVVSGHTLANDMLSLFKLTLLVEAIYGRLFFLVCILCLINVFKKLTTATAIGSYLISFAVSTGVGAILQDPAFVMLFFGGDRFWQKFWIPDIIAVIAVSLVFAAYVRKSLIHRDETSSLSS